MTPEETNSGTIYQAPNSFVKYEIPRTELLLHAVKKIEKQLLDWYKKNHCKNGDSYSVRITKKGRWAVSHSNDYPLQHGYGNEHILTEEEFKQATQP